MPKESQIDCKEKGCIRRGYWIEVSESGEVRFCIRTRHDGENHCQKFTLDELTEMIKRGI